MASGSMDDRRITFTNELLGIIGASVDGGSSAKRQRVARELATLAGAAATNPSRVADARFALGADDGAYLRTNVMPLQTAEDACDATSLASLHPELDRAGRMGVLTAVADVVHEKQREKRESLNEALWLCGWLMTIYEVSTFVDAYLTDIEDKSSAQVEAQGLAAEFVFDANNVDLTHKINDLLLPKNTGAACELLKIVLVLFGAPIEHVQGQWDATLGNRPGTASETGSTGTVMLEEALNRLALSARFVTETQAANDASGLAPQRMGLFSFPSTATAARAVGVSALANLVVDTTVVDFPPGWDDTDEGVSFDGSFTAHVDQHAHRLRKRVAMIGVGFKKWFDAKEIIRAPSDDQERQELVDFYQRRALEAAQRRAKLQRLKLEITQQYSSEEDLATAPLQKRRELALTEAEILIQRALIKYVEMERTFLELEEKIAKALKEFRNPDDDAELAGWMQKRKNVTEDKRIESKTAFANAVNEYELVVTKFDNEQEARNEDKARLDRKAARLLKEEATRKADEARQQELADDSQEKIRTLKEALTRTLANEASKAERLRVERQAERDLDRQKRADESQKKILELQEALKTALDEKAAAFEAAEIRKREAETSKAKEKAARERAKLRRFEDRMKLLDKASLARIDALGDATVDPAFCTPPKPDAVNGVAGVDALCAAVSQLREDGGATIVDPFYGDVSKQQEFDKASSTGIPPQKVFVRSNGIMAFFKTCEYFQDRTGTAPGGRDQWDNLLWPTVSKSTPVSDVNKVGEEIASYLKDANNTPLTNAATKKNAGGSPLEYCVARGLCGYRAPHQESRKGDIGMKYNLPRGTFPKEVVDPSRKLQVKTVTDLERRLARERFGRTRPPFVSDFVGQLIDNTQAEPRREKVREAEWMPIVKMAPMQISGRANPPSVFGLTPRGDDDRDAHEAVATAVVYESLVDYFRNEAGNLLQDKELNASDQEKQDLFELLGGGEPTVLFFRACEAAAKILQVRSLATVFLQDSLPKLCHPSPEDEDKNIHRFRTRPVLRCPGRRGTVLFPCDAGMEHWQTIGNEVKTLADIKPPVLGENQAYGAANGTSSASGSLGLAASSATPVGPPASTTTMPVGAPMNPSGFPSSGPPARNVIERSAATANMRSLLLAGDVANRVPLYVARPPGMYSASDNLGDIAAVMPREVRGTVTSSVLVEELSKADNFVQNFESVLRNGLDECLELERLNYEASAVERAKQKLRDEKNVPDDAAEQEARMRREAVWNDAKREACIAGDRLWAFVRQLSGTISENVDAVCQIDEGMLVRQQQQARERSARLSDRAVQEHMQLVRGVFSNVIRESGLTLGIDKDGDAGSLKLVSNALRKQASELANGTSTGEGFFSNSVRLENLLSKGTGEMTLKRLFQELQEAGRALQEAADYGYNDGSTSASTSLDFLSAPRNSLILRYKPEALAAMRQSFDTFQREMIAQHGRMYRTISAYELIEGNDEALTSAFAALTAHMLVHARMYSSATAMYVAAWPAAANAQQLKISLQRLVRVACDYISRTSTPSFLSTGGRASYFAGALGPYSGSTIPVIRFVPPPGGLWRLNPYGSS